MVFDYRKQSSEGPGTKTPTSREVGESVASSRASSFGGSNTRLSQLSNDTQAKCHRNPLAFFLIGMSEKYTFNLHTSLIDHRYIHIY